MFIQSMLSRLSIQLSRSNWDRSSYLNCVLLIHTCWYVFSFHEGVESVRLTHSIRLAGRFNDLFQPGSHFVLTTFPCELNMIFLSWVLGAPSIFLSGGFCVKFLKIFLHSSWPVSRYWFPLMLLTIRCLRHSKIVGRNKLKIFRWESKPL